MPALWSGPLSGGAPIPPAAMGPREEVERYKRLFGVGEQVRREVRV